MFLEDFRIFFGNWRKLRRRPRFHFKWLSLIKLEQSQEIERNSREHSFPSRCTLKLSFICGLCVVRKMRALYVNTLTHRSTHNIVEWTSQPLLNTMAMKCDRAIIHVLMTAFTTFISNLRRPNSFNSKYCYVYTIRI